MPGIFPSNTEQSENVNEIMAEEPITDSLAEEINHLTSPEINNEDQPPTTRPLTQNDEINKKLLASFLERMNNMQTNSNPTPDNDSCVENKIDDDNSW